MYFGAKSRFHDVEKVIEVLSPGSVEFHLTEEDVTFGRLNSTKYDVKYSVHLPEYWGSTLLNPVTDNQDRRAEILLIYIGCIRKALLLKSKFNSEDKLKVVLHPGGMSVDESDKNKDILYQSEIEFVKDLEDLPEFKGKIEILVENMPPLPWFYGGQYYSHIFCDADEIAGWCQKHERRICLDVSHLALYCNYAKKDLFESIKILKPYVAQVHLADASGTDGEGVPMGEGTVDFEKVMYALGGLDVAIIPETMWGHKANYTEFRRIIEGCKQWLT